MTRANLIFEPRDWWKVKLGIRHTAIKHIGAGPVQAGDTLHLHKAKPKQTPPIYIGQIFGKHDEMQDSMTVTVKGAVRFSIEHPYERDYVSMRINSTPIPQRDANRLAKRCGFKSWKHMFAAMQLYYGLPYHGQLVIW